jgi:hypothetical protein
MNLSVAKFNLGKVKAWLSNGLFVQGVVIVDGEGDISGVAENPLVTLVRPSETISVLGYVTGEGELVNPSVILNPPPDYEVDLPEPSPLFVVPDGKVARLISWVPNIERTSLSVIGGLFLMNGDDIVRLAVSSGHCPINETFESGSEIRANAMLLAGSNTQGTFTMTVTLEIALEDE